MKAAVAPDILHTMLSDLQTITRTKGSTQFYVFNLFADYILPYKNGWAWMHELRYLLDLLGVSDRAGRTTLSRMKQQGWFETIKDGRRSRYRWAFDRHRSGSEWLLGRSV